MPSDGHYMVKSDRQKRIVLNEKLLNIACAANGETNSALHLGLLLTVKTMKFFGQQQSHQETAVSTLKVDGRVQDGGVSQNIIEGLVPQQISQFLLFDGELSINSSNWLSMKVAHKQRRLKALKSAWFARSTSTSRVRYPAEGCVKSIPG